METQVFLTFLTLATIFKAFAAPSNSDTCYVSTTGSNSHDGSQSSPWLTIQHAVNNVGAGDPIYVKGGAYNKLVTFTSSGSASEGYITLQNYNSQTPVIDGTGLRPVMVRPAWHRRAQDFLRFGIS